MLKILGISLLASLSVVSAFAEPMSCPNLAGRYVLMECPEPSKPYSAMVIHQYACHSVGFQRIETRADGSLQYWPVAWELAGVGKVLQRESRESAWYKEAIFDPDTLYVTSSVVEKSTGKSRNLTIEVVDKMPDGSLFIVRNGMGSWTRWVTFQSCGLPVPVVAAERR